MTTNEKISQTKRSKNIGRKISATKQAKQQARIRKARKIARAVRAAWRRGCYR